MSDPIERLGTALKDRYRVQRELGEGGMATVYLAEDLKHRRKVAIKVLKPELAAVVGAERFLGEIETTANLQHPHILSLFDSGEADGFLFYVMPYVEGESLRDRLDREKQLPVDEAVSIAGKVGSALQAAHERGVVHRDIKPANILMDAHGEPLVADFGIALALSTSGGGRLTETGLSLGTPYYMSPEQASGEGSVDPRSDVYALGCVLYEMLVGDPPFQASTAQAVLARVLTSTPDRVMEHRSSVPPHVDAVVARSMERIPADRFGSVAELRRALDDEGFRHGGWVSVEAEPPKTPAIRGAIAGLAALTVVLAAVAWVGWNRTGGGNAPYRVLTLDTPPGGLGGSGIALSPDGRLLATVDSSGNLQVITFDGSDPPLLPEVTDVLQPKFSPDGSRLGFAMSGVSRTGWPVIGWIPTDGAGSATIEGELRRAWHWGPDGEIWMETEDGIRVVDSEGEPGELLPQPEGRWGLLLDPLPDGRFLARLSEPRDGRRLAVWDPGTGELEIPESQSELPGASDARFRNGFLFWRNGDGVLSATPFDIDGAGVTGPRIVLQDSVPGGGRFAILDDGTLVATTGRTEAAERNVGWVDLDGNVEIIHEPWADELEGIHNVALSPDGRRAAASVHARPGMTREGLDQIWVLDLVNWTANPLAFDGSLPVGWLGNGRITYFKLRDGRQEVLVAVPVDGSGTEEVLVEAPPGQYMHDFTVLPDSSGVVYTLHLGDHDDILHAPFEDGGAPRPWLATPVNESDPVVSPDGRWVAYQSTDTGTGEVYVRSFPDAGPPTRISTGGGTPAVWHPDGRTLYYSSSGQLRSARLAFDGDRVRVVDSDELFSSEPFRWQYASMDPATERFLFVVGSADPPDYRLRVHMNVFQEIQRRIEAGR